MTVRNMAFLNSAYRNLSINNNAINKTYNKLSSGYQVNSAADNAAGLAISEKMRGQTAGIGKALENAQHGISMVQTAEGTLSSSQSVLGRMRELAVQASNGTLSDDDRTLLNKEFSSLKSELDRVSSSANFNGMKILDGSLGGQTGTKGVREMGVDLISSSGSFSSSARFNISREDGVTSITAEVDGKTVTQALEQSATGATFDFGGGRTVSMQFGGGASSLREGAISGVRLAGGAGAADTTKAVSAGNNDGITLQIGADGNSDQRLTFKIGNMSSFGFGVHDVDISTVDGANSAISAIDAAINTASSERGNLGAVQNRLDHSISNLGVTKENLAASESDIRDADMAMQIMNLLRQNIVQSASQSMMAQSMNMGRQSMMSLLTQFR